MSELITTRARADIRLQLLATVSVLSLLTAITSRANAEDSSQPTVWIELGGQLERIEGGQDAFHPPFATTIENAGTICNPGKNTCGESAGFTSPSVFQRPPRYSNGAEAKISLKPEGSDWSFSLALRYGRSNDAKKAHEQTNNSVYRGVHKINPAVSAYYLPQTHKFSDTSAENHESHAILDFQAGKDVGLGMFGHSGSSVVGFGVRFAQFSSASHVSMKADPDLYYPGTRFKYTRHRHTYVATAHNERSFHGVGPSISWNASALVAGDPDKEQFDVDWGLNAAVLFGHQKASGSGHMTTTYLHFPKLNVFPDQSVTYTRPLAHARSESVVVPNIGGFAGVSLKFPNAKISVGYRADFFFGAVDGGVDVRKTYDRDFYGPFATISVGL